MIYEKLNDVAHNQSIHNRVACEFEPGPVEIWYAKNPTFMGDLGPPIENLYQSHIQLGSIAGDPAYNVGGSYDAPTTPFFERIFHIMQGDIWSPRAEARNLIHARGLQHTSMSVGDCIKIGENTWMVDNFGWKKIS